MRLIDMHCDTISLLMQEENANLRENHFCVDLEKMKKAEYMLNHVGEIFDGVISGVTNFGIYVELPNTVEGMVRLDSIKDDYYEYEEGKYRVIGRLSRREYKLGDAVQIEVIGASPETRQIDFVLFDENEW